MSIDDYEISCLSEDNCKLKLKYLVENMNFLFQLIVMDDDDEKYVPDFDFLYKCIDCSNMVLNT